VRQGEIVALVGANGSGKSTLLKAVAGLIRSKSGKVLFDGADVSDYESHELALRGMGFLLQGGAVFQSLTVMEHFQLAAHTLSRRDFEQRLPLVWQTFPALYTKRKKRAGFLSGGERQMLGFSNLLIRNARLWLLDEPTASLSPDAAQVLWETLERLRNEDGITVLLAEQNLEEALNASDRAYVIKHGLAFEEVPQAILSSQDLESFFFAETVANERREIDAHN
jgi:branched-chain amino acid transport system ATP-binding protein